MRTTMLRASVLAIVLAAAAAAPALAACLEVSVSVSPQSVCPGQVLSYTITASNSCESMQKATLQISVSGPGMGEQASAALKVPAGRTRSFSSQITVPPASPSMSALATVGMGTYNVSVDATTKAGESSSASASFTLVPCS